MIGELEVYLLLIKISSLSTLFFAGLFFYWWVEWLEFVWLCVWKYAIDLLLLNLIVGFSVVIGQYCIFWSNIFCFTCDNGWLLIVCFLHHWYLCSSFCHVLRYFSTIFKLVFHNFLLKIILVMFNYLSPTLHYSMNLARLTHHDHLITPCLLPCYSFSSPTDLNKIETRKLWQLSYLWLKSLSCYQVLQLLLFVGLVSSIIVF